MLQLDRLREYWLENRENDDEEFWQREFTRNAFVLSQVFFHPVLLLRGKAYVGGKGIDNRGGKIPDFVLKNPLTQHAMIVEIKTPTTQLLGSQYRTGVFGMSDDLNGALVQASRYRMTLMHQFKQLHYDSTEMDKFFAFDPPAVIIAGSLSEIEGDRDRMTCLELFRNGWKSVHLVSYDELFERMRLLVKQLESTGDVSEQLAECQESET